MAAIAVVAASSAAFGVFGSGSRPEVATAVVSTTTTIPPTTTTVPLAPPPAVAAATAGGALTVFTTPDAASAVVTTLSPRSRYEKPRTLLVIEQQPGWVHALLPIRPNGSTGWVRESDVVLSTTTFAINISLSRHELVLTDAGQVVLTTPTVIGRPGTPTPLGRFYVTDPVDLTERPSKVYGMYALGLSGFSEVLEQFQGGPGQIAVHGTPSTTDFGQDLSNGCVRVSNEMILQIAGRVPIGTPVTIEA